MRLKKSFQLAWNILIHSKLRSWLTIIGIVIGIAAVVSIVSISIGAKQQLENNLGNLGADILTLSPGFSKARGEMGFWGGGEGPGRFDEQISSESETKNITSKDVAIVRTLDNVDIVTGIVSLNGDLTYLTKTASVSVTGVDGNLWAEITTEEIESGRMLTSGDTYSIIVGNNLAKIIFDNLPINAKVTIEGKTFKVVGILESGNGVYMPIEIAREVFDDIVRKNLILF